jgi:hypothetical protein
MTTKPLLRISCQRARPSQVGTGQRQGVMLADTDVQNLRLLAERDFVVRIECRGLPTFVAHAQALLKRLTPVPGKDLWYAPTSLTGPLRPTSPPKPPGGSQ